MAGDVRHNKSDANLLLLRIKLFPESDTQLLAQTLKLLEVLLVLFLVLNLGLDTCYKESQSISPRLWWRSR